MQWNLKALFLVSSVMGAVSCLTSLLLLWAALDSCTPEDNANGVFEALGLRCVRDTANGDEVGFGLIVMMVYLKVAVSDFLTLFSARTGPLPFWATRPAPVLFFGAAFSLLVSTVIACAWAPGELDDREVAGLARTDYRIWAVWVWLYALIAFVVQDALKVGTYWLLEKYDIFHYSSGAMVATRDVKSFEDPAGKLAAGHIETKALSAALADGASTIARIARTSAHSGALQRVSNTMALGRVSLAAPLGRTSLVAVDESQEVTLANVDAVEAQLSAAAATLGPLNTGEVEAALRRVGFAASNLRRVSQAVDRQRLGRQSGKPPSRRASIESDGKTPEITKESV